MNKQTSKYIRCVSPLRAKGPEMALRLPRDIKLPPFSKAAQPVIGTTYFT